MTQIFAIFGGAVVGFGLWLVLLGARGTEVLSRKSATGSPTAQPHLKISQSQLLRKLGIGVVAAVFSFVITGWAALAVCVCVGIVLFWGKLSPKKQVQKTAERAEAISSWIEMLYSILLAGGGFEKAVSASARNAPEAIRSEVETLAARVEVVPLPDALEEFAHKVAHPACDKVAIALVLSASRGAQDLVGLLRSQAASARMEAQQLRSLQAGRARFLTSARIMFGATLSVAVGIYLFDDGYLQPYSTSLGQFMLFLVGAGFLGGYGLLVRMGKAPAPPRYFKFQGSEA